MKVKVTVAAAIVLAFAISAVLTAFLIGPLLGPLLGMDPTFSAALDEALGIYSGLALGMFGLCLWDARKRARTHRDERP